MPKTTKPSKSSQSNNIFLDNIPFMGTIMKQRDRKRVAVISLKGIIRPEWNSTHGINAAKDIPRIRKAFALKRLSAVILVINSPGGSPVQSQLIAKALRHHCDKKKIPLIAFVEDCAASGGYWLATAADKIVAADAALIGSIGVIRAGFGFPDMIRKLGIERRVHTAGNFKSRLDSFASESPKDVEWINGILEELHKQFRDHIKERRKSKLSSDKSIFEGEVWLAPKALKLGLIDEIGYLESWLEKNYGPNPAIINIAAGRGRLWSWLSRFNTFARANTLSDEVLDGVMDRVEDRLNGNLLLK